MYAVLLIINLNSSFAYADQSHARKSSKPNFLFICADDMRWDSMSLVQQAQGKAGCFPWFKTPNLDQLAAQGLWFKNTFAAMAVCSSSRAEFLTGRYSHLSSIANNQVHFLIENATWATTLRG